MQNIFLYEKNKKISEEAAFLAKKEEKLRAKRSKTKEVLSQKYKNRISNLFIQIPSASSKAPTSKNTESTKHFKTNYISEKERICCSISNNQWLDTTPTSKPSYFLRTRDRSKELFNDFHYRAHSTIARIQEVRKSQQSILLTSTKENSSTPIGRSFLYYYHPVSHKKTFEWLSQQKTDFLNELLKNNK